MPLTGPDRAAAERFSPCGGEVVPSTATGGGAVQSVGDNAVGAYARTINLSTTPAAATCLQQEQ